MDITHRYTNRIGQSFLVRLSYNEKIADSASASAFVRSLEVIDTTTSTEVEIPIQARVFSTYEKYLTFGSYCAINYFGARETAIEGLRLKILTRIEDVLERTQPAMAQ